MFILVNFAIIGLVKFPMATAQNAGNRSAPTSSGAPSPSNPENLPPLFRRDIPTQWDRAHKIIRAKLEVQMRNLQLLKDVMDEFSSRLDKYARDQEDQKVLNAQLREWMRKIQGATVLGNFVIRPIPDAPSSPPSAPSTQTPSPLPTVPSAPIVVPSDDEVREDEGVQDIQSC